MPDSRPVLSDTSPHPTDSEARPDACPECVVNVETPYVVDTADGITDASYCCSDCGHFWWTSWGA